MKGFRKFLLEMIWVAVADTAVTNHLRFNNKDTFTEFVRVNCALYGALYIIFMKEQAFFMFQFFDDTI